MEECGRVIDHIAFSVEGLDRAVAKLESEGVKVLQRPQPTLNGLIRSAFVEGPDGVEIEIVER
jgi:catechol 2,3-dioxygenase-like lactoylglutathione lyase family enzyme